jgi:transposase-like protein
VNSTDLQQELGLGSYKTAWTLHHKLRKAMVRPGRDLLSGEIEVDETFVGGPTPGRRGRSPEGKCIVAVAVEKPTGHVQHGFGRARLRVIPNAQRQTLEDFVSDVCEPGSIVYTDGHTGYGRLSELGFTHVVTAISSSEEPAHVAMPAVHRVSSLLKRWLLGTFFYRLIQLAARTRRTDYETIVWSRRPQMTKLRGRERGPRPPRAV